MHIRNTRDMQINFFENVLYKNMIDSIENYALTNCNLLEKLT